MDKWTLSKLPPAGHPDVGRWVWDNMYLVSEAEKERLNLKERWKENHRIFRGGSTHSSYRNKHQVTANLIHANIQRTVANLTAKNPSAEVVALDGAYVMDEFGEPVIDPETGQPVPDESSKKTTVYLKDWWNTSEQTNLLVDSALNMEIYGPVVEKARYNIVENQTEIISVDPFSFIIAPGNWTSVNDAPYCGDARAMRTDEVEEMFDLEPGAVITSEVHSLLGEDREDNRPGVSKKDSLNTSSTMYGAKTMHSRQNSRGSEDRALVVELWVRDNSTEEEPIVDEEGNPVFDLDEEGNEIPRTTTKKLYPGGIRVITVTNEGALVLSDMANPNVNTEIPWDQQTNAYLFNHLPYWSAVSYRDTTSFWGFAAAEQVGDLAEKMAEILSRMYRYLARVMLPPLVLPQDTGLTEDDVNNGPGLILTPISSQSGNGIHYLEVPSLPSDTVRLFEMLMGVFDRVYQIEDADRGDTPNRVVAASAIVALQERNEVLMRHKIRSVDYLIRQRGRAAISHLQTFGVTTEPIKVDEQITGIRGLDLLGRKFQYVVESGSTITQTSLQVQEQALDLLKLGAIDNQALLETLNFPGWRRIVERMAESGDALDQAAQQFVAAGVPQETVMQLLELARQQQFGQPPA
jgi:hypothetical protein